MMVGVRGGPSSAGTAVVVVIVIITFASDNVQHDEPQR